MKQFAGALSIIFAIAGFAGAGAYLRRVETPTVAAAATQSPSLNSPASGQINVAFVVSQGADLLDILGSWEVFSLSMLTSKGKAWHFSDGYDMVMPFHAYTVSESLELPPKPAAPTFKSRQVQNRLNSLLAHHLPSEHSTLAGQ